MKYTQTIGKMTQVFEGEPQDIALMVKLLETETPKKCHEIIEDGLNEGIEALEKALDNSIKGIKGGEGKAPNLPLGEIKKKKIITYCPIIQLEIDGNISPEEVRTVADGYFEEAMNKLIRQNTGVSNRK